MTKKIKYSSHTTTPLLCVIVMFLLFCNKNKSLEAADNFEFKGIVEKTVRESVITDKFENGTILIMSCASGLLKVVTQFWICNDDGMPEALRSKDTLMVNDLRDLPYRDLFFNPFFELQQLFYPFSLLAQLEYKPFSLNDSIDLQDGHFKADLFTVNDLFCKNRNCKMTIKDALRNYSHIALLKTGSQIFEKNHSIFASQLDSISFGRPYSNAGKCLSSMFEGTLIGYGVYLSSVQMLTLINAIANSGTMVKPLFKYDNNETVILKKSIARHENIEQVKAVLSVMTPASSDNAAVCGINDFRDSLEFNKPISSNDSIKYSSIFLGYFPPENPKYSVFIAVNSNSDDRYKAFKIADRIGREYRAVVRRNSSK